MPLFSLLSFLSPLYLLCPLSPLYLLCPLYPSYLVSPLSPLSPLYVTTFTSFSF